MKLSSTYKIFVAQEIEILWARLDLWLNCIDTKTTPDTYFRLCEQLDKEPVEEEIPPSFDDFPSDVQNAIIIFGKLGDKIVADIGYLGKDYTTLPIFLEGLEIYNREVFLDTLLRLDERQIKKSAEIMQRERKKLTRK